MGEIMNVIIFGPQGSGKGTQAATLAKDFSMYHLSMGDELRKEIKGKTAIGKKVEAIMAKGELVPVEITSLIASNVSKLKEAKNGILFDGYPRSPEQWAFMSKNFKIDAAIELQLSEKESINRIASRRMCPKCGKNYNLLYLKPKVAGLCDVDKTKLIQRDDDKPKEIKKRLEIYSSQTEPLKKEYKKLRILQVIDGSQPIEKVHNDILKILKKK
jgi:adenylate kinase